MRQRLRVFRSFRTQLTLTITVIVLGTIVLISLLANIFINMEFEKQAKEKQQRCATDIAANLSHQYDSSTGKWDLEYVHGVGMASLYDGYVIRLMDSAGDVVWDAENHDMETCSQIMMDIIERMELKRPGLNGSIVAKEYDLKHNNQKIGSVVIQYYGPYFLSESDLNFLDSLNLVLLLIGGLALLSSAIAAGFWAKRISHPIIMTANIAKQIAAGDFKIQFACDTKTQELHELASAVNHMAAFLDRQETLRRRLTGDIAHELRTPLSAVSSHLEAIIEGVWQPTPERLQSCFEEIDRISGLVADLENLEQVENANEQMHRSPLNLLELAQSVAGNFESEAAKKRIAIEVAGEPSCLTADRDRLTQVMTNLLSNAVKYTMEDGSIRISVKDLPDAGSFVVEDDGIGIPETDLPLIFERFYRTDISRNRQTGGRGIGLTIVKSIVNAHGGTIIAESDDKQGSRFTVTLPKY